MSQKEEKEEPKPAAARLARHRLETLLTLQSLCLSNEPAIFMPRIVGPDGNVPWGRGGYKAKDKCNLL